MATLVVFSLGAIFLALAIISPKGKAPKTPPIAPPAAPPIKDLLAICSSDNSGSALDLTPVKAALPTAPPAIPFIILGKFLYIFKAFSTLGARLIAFFAAPPGTTIEATSAPTPPIASAEGLLPLVAIL